MRRLVTRRRLAATATLLVIAVGAAVLVLRPAFEPAIDPQLRRQIGQMMMVGYRGTSVDQPWPRALRRQIADGTVGGVLVLGHNVASLAEVSAMNHAFIEAGGETPPLIALDQEGGRIQRLRSIIGFSETPSAAMVGRYADPQTARDLYATMAVGLAELGFNVNFGPVVDLAVEPDNPIIARLERAYSDDPDTVVQFASAFVEAHREAGVATSPKHFPGHGSTKLDSHVDLPDISASWSELELEPYRALIDRDLADMVMVGHLVLREGHAETALPATLSPAIVTGMLRGDFGFDGVVISDDLDMGAITGRHSVEHAAIAAIRAGIDIVIVSNFNRNDPEFPERLLRAIAVEAARDPALMEAIVSANARIAALKRVRFAPRRTARH